MNRPPPSAESTAIKANPLVSAIAATTRPDVTVVAGVYDGQFTLDRQVELNAADGLGSVRLVAIDAPVAIVLANATVRGLIFEGGSDGATHPVVVVEAGAAVFEGCEFRYGTVEVRGRGAPVFRGCSFVGSREVALHLTERGRAHVENCAFNEARGDAIVATDTAHVEITDTAVAGAAGAGIRVVDAATVRARSTSVRRCGGSGAVIADSASLHLENCQINDCSTEAVRVDGSSTSTAPAPPIRRAARPPGSRLSVALILESLSGPHMPKQHGVTLSGCRISGGLDGVVLSAGEADISNTSIVGVERTALSVGGPARVRVRKFAVVSAGATGVHLRDRATMDAAESGIARCGAEGLFIGGHAAAVFTNGLVAANTGTSVHVSDTASVTLRNAVLSGNGAHGVSVRGHAYAEIDGCRIECSARDGVRVEGAGDALLNETTIRECRIGIVFSTRHHPVARRCLVSDTKQMGIVVGTRGMPTLDRCSTLRSGSAGIFLDRGSVPQIIECDVDGASAEGLIDSRKGRT